MALAHREIAMNKHTPGPWRVIPRDGKFPNAVQRGREGGFEVRGLDNETEDADARLIAAAPELLAALSKAVAETEQMHFEAWVVRASPSGDVESVQRQWLASSDHRDFVDEWREQIDAIAKATGEA